MSVSLRGYGQFIAHLPDLLGFIPEASVIVVAMQEEQMTALVRLDATSAVFGDDAAWRSIGGDLRGALGGSVVTDVLVIEYRANEELDLEPLRSWLDAAVAPVSHSFVVVGTVWWAIDCRPGCCDGALHEVPAPPEPAPLDASGCLAAWRALAAQPPREPTADLEVAVAASRRPDLRDVLLCCVVPEMAEAMLADCLPAGAWIHDPGVRSRVADASVDALDALVRLVPADVRPYWLALSALGWWRAGDLRQARTAAAWAFGEGPHVPLARLVHALTVRGLPYRQVVDPRSGRVA